MHMGSRIVYIDPAMQLTDPDAAANAMLRVRRWCMARTFANS